MREDLQDGQHVNAAEHARLLCDTTAMRPAKIRRQPAAQPAVDRIETVPMTAAQRQQAVSALATLIARWEQAGRPTTQGDDTA